MLCCQLTSFPACLLAACCLPCLQVSNLKMNCTDVVMQQQDSASDLQRTLYCGYYQARCNGTSAANQYAAAFDWRGSNATRFALDLYYNDTYGLPKNEAPTVYQRVPQVW